MTIDAASQHRHRIETPDAVGCIASTATMRCDDDVGSPGAPGRGGVFVLSKILSEVKLRTEINFGFPYCGESRGVRLRFKKVVSLYSCLGEVVVLVLMQLWP